MTEKQILKSIKALAAGECANYHGGFCAETDRRCHLINPKYVDAYQQRKDDLAMLEGAS